MSYKSVKLGELFNLISGFPFKGSDFISHGIPVLKIKNIKANRILFDELSYVLPSVIENNRPTKIQMGDILITMTGNRIDGGMDSWVGKAAIFNAVGDFYLNQRVGILRARNKEFSNTYLGYILSSFQYQNILINLATGSGGQANLSPKSILDLEVELPTLKVQTRIAEILSSLDDKIELNRQMNQTLEEMAQAFYKHHFVDGIDPDNLPEGWRNGKLRDIIQLEYGKALKENERISGEYPVVGSSGIVGYHKLFLVVAPRIVVGRKGNAGSVIYMNKNFYPIDTTYFVTPNLIEFKPEYLYFLLTKLNLSNLNSDSAVPGVNREQAYNMDIIIPDINTINHYVKKVADLFSLKHCNSLENEYLSQTRDYLLPKLISGEVLPSDLKQIEQVL